MDLPSESLQRSELHWSTSAAKEMKEKLNVKGSTGEVMRMVGAGVD